MPRFPLKQYVFGSDGISLLPDSPIDVTLLLIGEEEPPGGSAIARSESGITNAVDLLPRQIVRVLRAWVSATAMEISVTSSFWISGPVLDTDLTAVVAKVAKDQKRTYSLVYDSNLEVARAFEVVFQPLGKSLLPVCAVFIGGREGKVKFQHVNPDYRVRLDVGALLAAARVSLN